MVLGVGVCFPIGTCDQPKNYMHCQASKNQMTTKEGKTNIRDAWKGSVHERGS